jgi:hypothetical protein
MSKMKKIEINQNKLDINFKFYLFLKEFNGTNGLTSKQLDNFLNIIFTYKTNYKNTIQILNEEIKEIKKDEKRNNIENILLQIECDDEYLAFCFALKLLKIKSFLLEEAKLVNFSEIIKKKNFHPLSLKYDTLSKKSPYYTRVNGALIALLFFEKIENKENHFLSKTVEEYILSLIREFERIKKINIEANQIFMLMFSESINQSIVSSAGSSYENRIKNILIDLGIQPNEIKKLHDKKDSSTEYDLFFKLGSKSYGIGAKRTLRERYKQFIKTSKMTKIDVMIEITLGLDLTETKAKAIRNHDIYLFVADEIYNSKNFLQKIKGIYPASKLTIELLRKL